MAKITLSHLLMFVATKTCSIAKCSLVPFNDLMRCLDSKDAAEAADDVLSLLLLFLPAAC